MKYEILDIYQFERSDLPLKELKEGDDYTFEKGTNKIVFSDSIFNQVLQGDNPRISIRYKHYGEFLIVDLVRDIVQFSQRKGRNEMNEHAIAKRLHYNFPGNDASISNFQ